MTTMADETSVTIAYKGREVHTTVGDMERLAESMKREPLKRKPSNLIPANDEVKRLADTVINEVHDHEHLLDARIVYLFRTDDWFKGRHEVHASIKPVADLPNAIMLAEFGIDNRVDIVVTINGAWWTRDSRTEEQKMALLDHEFCHIERTTDNKGCVRWSTREHDIQEFADVARRRGKWDYALQELTDAIDEYEQENLPGVQG